MTIQNRDLPVGTRLVATYKKQAFVCTVEKEAVGGTPVFVLADGRRFKSPSAAGSVVMGGVACNGWRFWSLEGEAQPALPAGRPAALAAKPAKKAADAKAEPRAKAPRAPRKKAFKLFERIESKADDSEGTRRFWCNACAASFVSETNKPEACAKGHRADDPELTAAPAPETVAAEAEAERPEPVAVEA